MSSYALTFEQATRGIFASWRLFLRDPRAAELLENNYRGAVRSYWAAIVILPVYAMTVIMEYMMPASGYANFGKLAEDTNLWNAITTEVIVYTLCWFVAWPLIVDLAAPLLKCEQNFFRYICAYNWMHFMYAVVGVVFWSLAMSGVVDARNPDAGYAATVCLLVVLWTYHWFVVRHTLGVNAIFSTLLVGAEFMFTTMLLDFIVNVAAQ